MTRNVCPLPTKSASWSFFKVMTNICFNWSKTHKAYERNIQSCHCEINRDKTGAWTEHCLIPYEVARTDCEHVFEKLNSWKEWMPPLARYNIREVTVAGATHVACILTFSCISALNVLYNQI